jgi:D-alanyl-D-alanine carboxypeptidase (penicillin-binding protein 5/6)
MRFRVVLFFVLLLGAGFFAIHKGFGFSSDGDQGGKADSRPAVQGVSDERRDDAIPIYFESRAAAAEFRPIPKVGIGRFAVPGAHASIVLDVDSGVVMHENNAHVRRQIASLTKLMTAMIVVERIKDLDEAVTIDEEAVYAEGTRVGCPRSGFCNGQRLKAGEQVKVRDLLKAALMNSANDAAIALGKHIGGTQEGFAAIMNRRAKELGLRDTNFCTPSGLEPDGRETECYSSAYDIAKITANALKYDILWEIMRLPNMTIYSADGQYAHDIFNTDALLGQYPNLLGTKTGFTPMAGYSLLAVATDPSRRHRVVSVVLNDPQRWQDIQSMFSWAFTSHVWR